MEKNAQHSKLISCEEALRHVFDYVDNQLSGRNLQEVEDHIEKCRHCYDRVEFEKLLKARIKNINPKTDNSKLMKKIDSLINSF
jgi:anti-sigma factor (TIGR02949 family)